MYNLTVQDMIDILQRCPKDAVVFVKFGTYLQVNQGEITCLPKKSITNYTDKQVVIIPVE